MVGGQVGDHGDVGAPVHGHQLEGGQLQHGDIPRLHAVHVGQQGLADVAAHIDGLPRRLEQLGDDGGGGGFSVAAGDGDGAAGADLEKDLHLRGQDGPLLLGGHQLGQVGPHTGCAEDDLKVQVLQVVLPQLQGGPQALQLLDQTGEGAHGLFVAGGDLHPRPQQHFDQGGVGHADADDGHPLALQTRQIFLYGGTLHNSSSLFIV